jgi:hypothetical protein
MANNHGGKRLGAGRKKEAREAMQRQADIRAEELNIQPLSVDGDLIGAEMPPPHEYLMRQTRGISENHGKEIYERLWKWLKERDCHLLVNNEMLQQYAMTLARCEQLENAIHDFGFLAKHPTTSNPIESPYAKECQRWQKLAQSQWAQIEVGISDRLRYFVDRNAKSDDPLDVIINNAINGTVKNGGKK